MYWRKLQSKYSKCFCLDLHGTQAVWDRPGQTEGVGEPGHKPGKNPSPQTPHHVCGLCQCLTPVSSVFCPPQENLRQYVDRIFNVITTSGVRCPTVMCDIFFSLRESAATRFQGTLLHSSQVMKRNRKNRRKNRNLWYRLFLWYCLFLWYRLFLWCRLFLWNISCLLFFYSAPTECTLASFTVLLLWVSKPVLYYPLLAVTGYCSQKINAQ